PCAQGLVQQETHVLFESLIQSGLLAWAQGTVIPNPDVTVDEATSPCSLSPLGTATSVSLSVRSKSVVDEDSWTTFSDVSSS
ncbi:hypothetical protein Tco_0632162, partial [Tanacetum coccineum]